MKIELINLRIGNVASVCNMLRHVGFDSVVLSDPAMSSTPDWLILPGVGAFDHGMQRLRESGFDRLLLERAADTKILGICLGMQMLCERSEEGVEPGLALLPGGFVRFPDHSRSGLRVPHMGWNETKFNRSGDHPSGFEESFRFYFVHTFHYDSIASPAVWACTDYGVRFASAIHQGSVYGVQFHPEKSHKYGIRFLTNLLSQPCFDQE